MVQPLEYLMTAKELGNNVLRVKGNKVLEQYLTSATIMVVSVTASTTQGTELPQEDLDIIGRVMYRVTLVVAHLGWVALHLGCSTILLGQ